MLRATLAVWAIAVVAGMGFLERYAARPGDGGAPVGRWLSGTRLTLATGRPTLLLFIDAACPCSRASLTELGRIAARARADVAATIVVSGGTDRLAEVTGICPGIPVELDASGTEAARFGVMTSGHTLLFAPSGRLLFSGGITAARGHEGDSNGAAAVLAGIADHASPLRGAPVFGCPIAPSNQDGDVRERPR